MLGSRLEEGRKAVMQDLGYSIPMLSVDYFKSALLPPLREGLTVDNIVQRLSHAKAIIQDEEGTSRWSRFKYNPSDVFG